MREDLDKTIKKICSCIQKECISPNEKGREILFMALALAVLAETLTNAPLEE